LILDNPNRIDEKPPTGSIIGHSVCLYIAHIVTRLNEREYRLNIRWVTSIHERKKRSPDDLSWRVQPVHVREDLVAVSDNSTVKEMLELNFFLRVNRDWFHKLHTPDSFPAGLHAHVVELFVPLVISHQTYLSLQAI
jgi:hypothetical protein